MRRLRGQGDADGARSRTGAGRGRHGASRPLVLLVLEGVLLQRAQC